MCLSSSFCRFIAERFLQAARVFRKAVSPQKGETGGSGFDLCDGNAMFYWGGTSEKWERREWIGHSWGAVGETEDYYPNSYERPVSSMPNCCACCATRAA